MKISEILDSDELFLFEEKFLKFFGIWPSEKVIKWRISCVLLYHIIFNLIAQINCLIEALKIEDYLKVISVAPKILIAIVIILSALSVLLHKDKFNFLIKKIKSNWHKHASDEFPKWNEHRKRLVKIGNLCIACTLCLIHIMSFVFHYTPNIKFFVQYIFGDLDLMDPNIDRETILRVK